MLCCIGVSVSLLQTKYKPFQVFQREFNTGIWLQICYRAKKEKKKKKKGGGGECLATVESH